MKKNFYFKSILIIGILFLFFINIEDKKRVPTPTEYIQKKKDRKKIKKDRKQWIIDMHKSHPDVDWREVDKQNRKINTDKIRDIRSTLLNSENFNNLSDNYEVIRERDIEGTWVERGSNNLAGRIRTADIDFTNNNIYCASSGGNIWKGTIDGENWESLNDYMQILGITFLRIVDTENSQRLLIGSENNGFYYSDNDCVTLSESNGLGTNSIKRIIMQHNTNHIYALVNDSPRAIYRSTDLGENFELYISLDEDQGIPWNNISHFDIFTPRYFESYIYLINDMSFYRISGNDLILISELPGSYSNDVLLTGGTGASGTFLYAYVGGQIFKSINGGSTWAHKGDTPSSWWWINGFNSSNLERDRIFVGGMEIFRSSSGGNDWTLVNPWWEYYDNIENKLHADIPEVRFFLDEEYNEIALISTDGGLYISDDYLLTVQNISLSGLGVSQYYSTYSQRFFPYSIFAGSQDQGLQKSTVDNGGIRNFEQIISGDYGHLVSGDNGTSIWTNYPGFTIYYPNIANSNLSYSLDFPGSGHLWIPPLMEDPNSSEKVFLGGGGINGGNYLIELTFEENQINYNQQEYNFAGTVSAMGYSPLDSSYRYVLTDNGKFYYSSDNGESWLMTASFTGPGAHYFYGSTIWASPHELGRVFIGGSGYSNSPVYMSENHGQNFIEMDNGLPSTLVFQISGTPNDAILFAATEIGPYGYSYNEEEWFLLSGISAPDQTYWTVDFIPEINTARFGTYGRGIWDFIINDNYNINFGDINNDGTVNVQDIILVINFILEINEPTELQFLSSDINEDGIINILDIVLIVDIIFED
tara:strand:- start:3658 stop:6102 length:2445 start_codon:yes stop_codon:yes gene_type:complete